MVSICPTVTTDDPDVFRVQVCQAADLSLRIHIDAADGELAPRALLPLADIWWPAGILADLHLMYARPLEHLDAILALQPRLVIAHAEASGDFKVFSNQLRSHGIQAGVALLPQTPVSVLSRALEYLDHVLIFSGNLGYQGGSQADPALLQKVHDLRGMKPQLEFGWDGGVNDANAAQLVAGGIEVLNVGGYLQTDDRHAAYAKLEAICNQPTA